MPYTAWVDNAGAGTHRYGSANCGYTVNYSALWRNFYDTTLPLPTMVNWKWNGGAGFHAFWIYSDNTDMAIEYDRKEFIIELTGCTDITDMDPIFCEVWTLTITVENTCPTDVLSLDATPAYAHTFVDYTYYIDENTDAPGMTYNSGKLDHQRFHANWLTSIPYCPLDFEILRDYTDNASGQIATNYVAFTQGEAAAITLINPEVIKTPTTDWTNDVATNHLTWEE